MNILGAALGAVLDGVSLISETELDNEMSAIRSREWNRAVRAQRLLAIDALQEGATQAGAIRMAATNLEGQQRNVFATNLVDASSGTAAGTIASSRLMSELDASTALNNARRRAMGHKTAELQLEEAGRAEALARKSRDTGRALRAFSLPLKMLGGA